MQIKSENGYEVRDLGDGRLAIARNGLVVAVRHNLEDVRVWFEARNRPWEPLKSLDQALDAMSRGYA